MIKNQVKAVLQSLGTAGLHVAPWFIYAKDLPQYNIQSKQAPLDLKTSSSLALHSVHWKSL